MSSFFSSNLTIVEKTQQELEDEYEEDWTVVDLTTIPDDTLVQKLWWFYTWPINVLYFLTVPDSRLEKRRKLYPLTFIYGHRVDWNLFIHHLLDDHRNR
ncbi:unnamed protein product [Timema podura]|uniref:Uncharacterized protein n=1 Tax=Timema podura TaxID=61482 RepID=A0ABN7PNW8_TIMPD|nr:unnamed protein product [Timema podura]